MGSALILPAFFFGDISYYVNILQNKKVIIDLHENYVKQSQRNHTRILGPNGIQKLSIPVSFSNSHKTKTKDVNVSLSASDRRGHVQSISTAYGSAPFFDSFLPLLMDFFEENYRDLGEMHKAALKISCSILEIDHIEYSQEYIERSNKNNDLRSGQDHKAFKFPPYPQVFSGKHGFVEDLSILDLIFNEGRWSREYLKNVSLRSL